MRQCGSAAFYSVSSSGLYGFAFADLSPSFSYQYTVKSASGSEAQGEPAEPQTKTITESQSLEAFLESFSDES